MNLLKKEKLPLIYIYITSFLMFLPSLFVFYTNDDFFFLKISRAENLSQVINFFNLLKGPDGFGMYRPLTSQMFYWLSWTLFNLNPIGLHLIVFLIFFAVIYLVYLITRELTADIKLALISAFMYATSATHFAHLYYLATFQELGMTFFVLLSCLNFIRNKSILSIIFFILALLSKETAIITPLLLVLIYFYQKQRGFRLWKIKKIAIDLMPFIILIGIYLVFRISSYGFATGNTYIWDFSPLKLINTLFWYSLWTLNLPETILDFVGPGIKINPNLLLYWSNIIIPIFYLFFVQLIFLSVASFKILKQNLKDKNSFARISLFSGLWYLFSLLPVVFLPEHKFSYYLTLPLISVVLWFSFLLKRFQNDVITGVFLGIWLTLSALAIKHSMNTSWITQGEMISQRVSDYIKVNNTGSNIVLIDTDYDKNLPWSPTGIVKVTLSGQNFFKVFFINKINNVVYLGNGDKDGYKNYNIIKSRRFLGY